MIKLILIFWAFFHSSVFAAATFGIMGDAGVRTESTRALRLSLQHSKVFSLIMPGDNLYYPLADSFGEVWDPWLQNGFEFSVVALGNHPYPDGLYMQEMRYFGLPGEYYEVIRQGVRFLVLNSDNLRNVKYQAAWLAERLREKHPHTFVVFHHPPLTLSARHTWQERQGFQNAIRPLLLGHADQIRAILVGHDHLASFIMWGNIPVVVSGAGFESFPARPIDQHNPPGVRGHTLWSHTRGYYWTRLDVDVSQEDGDVWFNFVSLNSGVHCSINVQKIKGFPLQQVKVGNNCRENGALGRNVTPGTYRP